jgi:hypothetical protein
MTKSKTHDELKAFFIKHFYYETEEIAEKAMTLLRIRAPKHYYNDNPLFARRWLIITYHKNKNRGWKIERR